MPASEIDAIFAGRGAASGSSSSTSKLKAAEPESTLSKTEKKKSKKKKRKAVYEDEEATEGKKVKAVKDDRSNNKAEKEKNKTKMAKVPETIIDPSSIIQANMKKKKVEKKPKLSEADEEFRDSRGSIRKRTEDGFLIYSAEELQIDENSGGTPLCPFDCDCCH